MTKKKGYDVTITANFDFTIHVYATIHWNVHEDCEGLTYNSVEWRERA